MRMLCTIIQPSEGEILWNGKEIWKLGSAYREVLGYLPQEFGYYPDLNVYDYMMYISSIKGLKQAFANRRIKQLLEQVDMWKFRKRKMKHLSGGMVRRVGIAQAMLNDPKILVLDEPTAGLDPNERIRFRNLISELSENRLVLLSTHIVSDIEYIANEILLMKDGMLCYTGTSEELLSSMQERVWLCQVPARSRISCRVRCQEIWLRFICGNIWLEILKQPKMAQSFGSYRRKSRWRKLCRQRRTWKMHFCFISGKNRRNDRMLKLELKRIFSKKLNVLAVGLMVILAAVFSGFAATSNRYVDAHGTVSTGMLATRKLVENKNGYAGALTEAELTKIVVQYKAVMAQSQEEQDENYGTLYQPIDDILNFMISVLTPDAGYDETVLDSVTEDSVQDFYTWYRGNMKWMADQYGKTPEQKDYLEKKYSEIILPLQYESYGAWDTMIMYAETYSIVLAILVGFICAGIFADDFQTKADAVFFASKYGRSKAIKNKILAGVVATTMIYWTGIVLLSAISFGIMGTSGMHTPYQMSEAYSIYIMTYGQYYALTVACGYIASLLAASLAMLVAAKMHTISVAVCIPFFLYCLLPFIGRVLSSYTKVFNLIPTILTNVEASVRVPLLYQIGTHVIRQVPLVMVMYTVLSIVLLPLIYRSFRRYGRA